MTSLLQVVGLSCVKPLAVRFAECPFRLVARHGDGAASRKAEQVSGLSGDLGQSSSAQYWDDSCGTTEGRGREAEALPDNHCLYVSRTDEVKPSSCVGEHGSVMTAHDVGVGSGHQAPPAGIKTFLIYPDTLIQNALCLVKSITPPGLGRLIDMGLAPLRRIVSRTLEVFSERPFQFAIHDQLECGHVTSLLDWDLFDLIDPYRENSAITSRRHRCHECAAVVAQKKPVASVGLAKVEVA